MALHYHAPKPKYTAWTWLKYLGFRLFFPPVFLWDLMKLGANKLFGEWVGRLILPAQSLPNFTDINEDNVGAYDEDTLTCSKLAITTHDGACLDTFEIKNNNQSHLEPKYQKYVIYFGGNLTHYEYNIDSLKEDARNLKANVVGFNLRGVGKSTGKAQSKDNLVTDGIAQVQRLIDQGVSPENIILNGHSLGGAIATLVAKHFHGLKQPINLFNSRSFSSITDFLVGYIRLLGKPKLGHKERLGGIVLGWLAKPIIKFVVSLVNWEIDAGSAFKKIPEAYREYIVVRTNKKNREKAMDDAVIPHYASIHKALSAERRDRKTDLKKQINNLKPMVRAADPIVKPDLSKAKQLMKKALYKIKNDRKVLHMYPKEDGHNADMGQLYDKKFNRTAYTFFKQFVERTDSDHAIHRAAPSA